MNCLPHQIGSNGFRKHFRYELSFPFKTQILHKTQHNVCHFNSNEKRFHQIIIKRILNDYIKLLMRSPADGNSVMRTKWGENE